MGFIDALTAKGYSPDKLKGIFESEDFETNESHQKLRDLVDYHRNMVSDGLDYNFDTCPFFNAIDKAFDSSQAALANVAIKEFLDPGLKKERKRELINQWSLKRFVRKFIDPETKKEFNEVDVPAFYECIIPIVAAYVRIRWAKLFADRDVTPVYKYEPTVQTTVNHALCQVITTEISRQDSMMGYRWYERDIILPTLNYGYAWSFAKTDYYTEKSIWKGDGATVETYVTKEGMLWENPHPTRVMFDRTCPIQSINTDTGISWAAYWVIVPFSTIQSNDKFFNKDRVRKLVPSENSWVKKEGWKVYTEFYPCVIKFPEASSFKTGVPDNDRQEHYYTTANCRDNIQLVPFFHKLVPKDWGLFDCDVPVWFRFIYAGDGTLVCLTPFAYCPVNCNTYDIDGNRERPTSLAMELVGFEDLLTNLLTQYRHAISQNQINVVFVNTEQVPKTDLEALKTLPNRKLVGTHWIPFRRAHMNAQANEAGNAFHRPEMPRNDETQIYIAIDRVIAVMERILGISPQEVGSAASHQQSAEEITLISSGSSSRVQLTGSNIDAGRTARARATYEAWYEHSEMEIDQEIDGLNDVQVKALKNHGFEVGKIEGTNSVKLTGKRQLAEMDSFAQVRPPQDRIQDSKLAIAMIQAIQMLFSNPQLVEYFGVDYMMQRFNQILEYVGVPNDWRFTKPMKNQGPAIQQQEQMQGMAKQIMEATQQLIEQSTAQIKQGLQTEVIEPIGQRLSQLGEEQKAIGQAVTQVEQREQAVEQTVSEHQRALEATVAKIQELFAGVQASNEQLALLSQAVSPVAPQQLVV